MVGNPLGAAFDAAAKERVANASAEQIERWAGRMLSAASLADVLSA